MEEAGSGARPEEVARREASVVPREGSASRPVASEEVSGNAVDIQTVPCVFFNGRSKCVDFRVLLSIIMYMYVALFHF